MRAQQVRAEIVKSNLSSPKPDTPAITVTSSADYLGRKGAHTFRSPLHEGRQHTIVGDNVGVIAHLGFNLGRVGPRKGWINQADEADRKAVAQWPERVRPSKRFAKDGYSVD